MLPYQFRARDGHRYPKIIAEAYLRLATADDAPVADIGCGTGIVAAELKLATDQIDGMDISPEMLVLPQEKTFTAACLRWT